MATCHTASSRKGGEAKCTPHQEASGEGGTNSGQEKVSSTTRTVSLDTNIHKVRLSRTGHETQRLLVHGERGLRPRADDRELLLHDRPRTRGEEPLLLQGLLLTRLLATAGLLLTVQELLEVPLPAFQAAGLWLKKLELDRGDLVRAGHGLPILAILALTLALPLRRLAAGLPPGRSVLGATSVGCVVVTTAGETMSLHLLYRARVAPVTDRSAADAALAAAARITPVAPTEAAETLRCGL